MQKHKLKSATKDQFEAQRSGFKLKRRSDGVSELSPEGGSEGYEVRDDEGV